MNTTPSLWRMGADWRLWQLGWYNVDRMAILVAVRRFPCMGVAGSRSLRFDIYVRVQHFVRRSTSLPLL
jgi:hypothetical protein